MIDIQQVLNQHQNGSLLVEINETMEKLVTDCISTGKKGVLTLAINMEPVALSRGGHQMRIAPLVTSKNPRYDTGVGFFYVVTDENDKPVGLEREDPTQMQLYNVPDSERKEVR